MIYNYKIMYANLVFILVSSFLSYLSIYIYRERY